MRQKVYYGYKQYPFSHELTHKSKYVGYYTEWFIALPLMVLTMLALIAVAGRDVILSENFPVMWCCLGIVIGWIVILSLIRKMIYRKMDQEHRQIMEDMLRYKPERFMELYANARRTGVSQEEAEALYRAYLAQKKA